MATEPTLGLELVHSLFVSGTSFLQAPIEIRERLALSGGDLGPAAEQLAEENGIQEALLLSLR